MKWCSPLHKTDLKENTTKCRREDICYVSCDSLIRCHCQICYLDLQFGATFMLSTYLFFPKTYTFYSTCNVLLQACSKCGFPEVRFILCLHVETSVESNRDWWHWSSGLQGNIVFLDDKVAVNFLYNQKFGKL